MREMRAMGDAGAGKGLSQGLDTYQTVRMAESKIQWARAQASQERGFEGGGVLCWPSWGASW